MTPQEMEIEFNAEMLNTPEPNPDIFMDLSEVEGVKDEEKKSPIIENYWLAKKAREVINSLDEYREDFITSGRNPFYDMWYRNAYAYYSTILDSDSVLTALNFRGEQGELVKMSVPESRSMIQDVLTLSTKQKLNFKAILNKDGTVTLDAARKANALLEAKTRNGALNRIGKKALENALVLGTGFLGCFWRFDKGVEIGTNEKGGVLFSGESEIVSINLADIILNYRIENFRDQPWVQVRFRRNRFDLLAMYPELEREIMKIPSCSEVDYEVGEDFDMPGDKDEIYEYVLIHKQCPALPKGRYLSYASESAIFYDTDNIYPEGIPIVPVIAEPISGYGLGYPLFSSLLPAQNMLDHEFSVTATNHAAFGMRNICAPTNSNVDVKKLDGMNLVVYSPQNVPGGGKPELLQFDAPHTDFYNFADRLQGSMQKMTKLNNAIRGDLPASTSGVAIATLTTNALEFLSGYSEALYSGLEEILYYDLMINRDMVKNNRSVAYGIGSQKSSVASLSWTGKDLEAIKGISIVAVNPMLQTMAGRIDIGDKLLERGLVTDVKEYFAVLDGAPPERMYQNELSEDDLLAGIREMLLQGQVPPVLSTDDHPRLIRYALALLNDMEIRLKGDITKPVTDFVLECYQQAMKADPVLQAMARTGKMPNMPPPPPGEAGPDVPADSEQMPVGPDVPNDMSDQAESMIAPGGGTPSLPETQPADDLLGRQ